MSKKRAWLPKGDGKTLCMDGYPIEIRRYAPTAYRVFVEGAEVRPDYVQNYGQMMAAQAKLIGERLANELDEFEVLEPEPRHAEGVGAVKVKRSCELEERG